VLIINRNPAVLGDELVKIDIVCTPAIIADVFKERIGAGV
jgi:hypothetical protein